MTTLPPPFHTSSRGLATRGIHYADRRGFSLQRPLAAQEISSLCRRSRAKYRINPGNVSIGRRDDDNFRTMVEVAVQHQKPVRIGVNWGSLDQALLTRMMDENSKLRTPAPARDVMMEAMVVSALDNAAAAER